MKFIKKVEHKEQIGGMTCGEASSTLYCKKQVWLPLHDNTTWFDTSITKKPQDFNGMFQSFSGETLALLNRTSKGEISVKESPGGGVIVNQEYFDPKKMEKFGALGALFFGLLTTNNTDSILTSGFSQIAKSFKYTNKHQPQIITTSTPLESTDAQVYWTAPNSLHARSMRIDIGNYKV